PSASIIDVGGGASTLVADLWGRGFSNLTVLDLSDVALSVSRARLGTVAASVQWITADVTTVVLPVHAYDVWHDRAVFHFLATAEERRAYVAAALRSVKPGGHVIVATFAEDGPTRCSGLPVHRYGAGDLHATFGSPFTLLSHEEEDHHTPSGGIQKFLYCFCRKAS
ncbi:MAG TPA: class I SAM-dependent methyltransferase, partial [Planctomycetota bacterium]|nr:class I SAM-dependent methyltransferase [Planctomycetota bacterium]